MRKSINTGYIRCPNTITMIVIRNVMTQDPVPIKNVWFLLAVLANTELHKRGIGTAITVGAIYTTFGNATLFTTIIQIGISIKTNIPANVVLLSVGVNAVIFLCRTANMEIGMQAKKNII